MAAVLIYLAFGAVYAVANAYGPKNKPTGPAWLKVIQTTATMAFWPLQLMGFRG